MILDLDTKVPESIIYRVNTPKPKTKKNVLRVYNLFDIRLKMKKKDMEEFVRGYNSGMARIARTSYNFPDNVDLDYYMRGFRYAWLCHMFCLKINSHEFPDINLRQI